MPLSVMPGVNEQLLPLHGALSISSLAPATNTDSSFGSMATATDGSFCLLRGKVVLGLPTVTRASDEPRLSSPAEATGLPAEFKSRNNGRTPINARSFRIAGPPLVLAGR